MQPTIHELIQLYDLHPHPEGGFFKETYRAAESIPAPALSTRFGGNRSYSTSIYFLLPEGKKSSLHRIQSDEVWHFYLGGPLTVVEIHPDGHVVNTILGSDVKNGQKLQHVVPHGVWFGAHPNPGSLYSFVGCTVAPGFDFADFEMGKRDELLAQFPDAKEEIVRLT